MGGTPQFLEGMTRDEKAEVVGRILESNREHYNSEDYRGFWGEIYWSRNCTRHTREGM